MKPPSLEGAGGGGAGCEEEAPNQPIVVCYAWWVELGDNVAELFLALFDIVARGFDVSMRRAVVDDLIQDVRLPKASPSRVAEAEAEARHHQTNKGPACM
jgi:hypothetical protein